jgi:transcriptional regulator with PAS, ATPase and Fis domain
MEREMIREAVSRHEGNLSAVAQQLGITRQTLYNKLKRYEL